MCVFLHSSYLIVKRIYPQCSGFKLVPTLQREPTSYSSMIGLGCIWLFFFFRLATTKYCSSSIHLLIDLSINPIFKCPASQRPKSHQNIMNGKQKQEILILINLLVVAALAAFRRLKDILNWHSRWWTLLLNRWQMLFFIQWQK